MDVVLELKGITKRFGRLTANDRISLSVQKGSVHAIIGENGAGKSTLMHVISGLYRPDEGEVFVHGKRQILKIPAMPAGRGLGWCTRSLCCFRSYRCWIIL